MFVKQISVWNQTEKKKLQGITFTLFYPFQSVRFSLFRKKYMFNTYNYTLCFLKRPYVCLTCLSSSATDHQYSVLSDQPYRYSSCKRRGTGTTQPFSFLPRRRICMRCCMKPDSDLNQSKTKLSHTGGGSINLNCFFFLGGGGGNLKGTNF